MTTMPGCNSKAEPFVTEAFNALPSIAPVMIHGAIRLSWDMPAMTVCVFHTPNGASISKHFRHRLRPHVAGHFGFDQTLSCSHVCLGIPGWQFVDPGLFVFVDDGLKRRCQPSVGIDGVELAGLDQ
jgi:hypothetical protein